MRKKKILIIVLFVVIFGFCAYGTYAMFTTELLTGDSSISTGQVKMSYSESNEITLNNVVPTSDEKGISSTDYFEFKVNTYIKTNKEKTMNYNIVIEPLDVDSSYTKFNDSDIKLYLTKVENNTETLVTGPITIDELNQYVLKSQEETFNKGDTEHSTTYRLRTWLDYNFDASKINNKTYSYKFRVNVNNNDAPKEVVPILGIQVGTNGIEKVTHEIDNTLQVDSRFMVEYRYQGINVNNYVTFNDESWRILGVIPTENKDGDVENRLKIVKSSPIGKMSWNDCTKDGLLCKNTNMFMNDWNISTLNTYLNSTYLNNIDTKYANMLENAKYYLGGYYMDDNVNMQDLMVKGWRYERKKANDDESTYYFEENGVSNSKYAISTIVLPYASDYALSYDSSGQSYAAFTNSISVWSLTTLSDAGGSLAVDVGGGIWIISVGSANLGFAWSNSYYVLPALTLSSDVKISSGSGTSSDPYQLSL